MDSVNFVNPGFIRFVTIHRQRQQQMTDRQNTMTVAKLCNLQRLANKNDVIINFEVLLLTQPSLAACQLCMQELYWS